MSIGSQIAKRRKELGMTQESLAFSLGVSFQAVSAWEREIYLPETDKLKDIAKILSTSAAWLLEEDALPPRWELHDEIFSIDRMYMQVKAAANALGFVQTQKALVLMENYHEGQVRKGKDKVPYIFHPLMITCHALALGLKDDVLLSAALLHDVVEDCGVRAEDLDVSEPVREAVRLLSFSQGTDSREEAKEKYYAAMRDNKIAAMVKLLDRCNNISLMAMGFGKEKMADYIDETETKVFSLLNHVKHNYPEYYNAVFLLKYQMVSVMETLKRLL